jgi:DNA-binding response OmpR family regulator
MKILVIDDDPATTDLLKLILEPATSNVLTANSGPEGIQIVRTACPDIVILDLMMPDMNGWQVCKIIREFSHVSILILSALDSPGLVAAALDAGADDYLIKPVPTNVLMAHIHTLVRRTRLLPGMAAVAMS